jgi:hypothetical protein
METSRDCLPTGSRLPRLIQALRILKVDLTSGDRRLTTFILELRGLWRNWNRIISRNLLPNTLRKVSLRSEKVRKK